MSGETGWRAVAEADGWGDINVDRVRAQAAESIAWALLDETMDTADREPSEEAYKAALATADRMLALAARRESLAERVKALADDLDEAAEKWQSLANSQSGIGIDLGKWVAFERSAQLVRALLDPGDKEATRG